MSLAEILVDKPGTYQIYSSHEWRPAKTYRVHLLITRDENGVFSAVALNLPGAGSCGDTKEEAIENAREAVRGVLETHLEAGETIPWKDTTGTDIPFGSEQKWIIVDA